MKPRVYIRAHVSDESAFKMSTLVFKTLRVGFPNSQVYVWYSGECLEEVLKAGDDAECCMWDGSKIPTHDAFVAKYSDLPCGSIVFCDTDMVFYEKVEDWSFDQPMAGMFEPKHRNPVTSAIHLPRLHSCLLWVKPESTRKAFDAWKATLPPNPFLPLFEPWRQQWLPIGRELHFADTGSIAYNAIGGQHFTEQQLNAFAHLQCGTWSKYVEPHIPGLRESHRMAIEHPELFRGNWKTHKEWYERHQP